MGFLCSLGQCLCNFIIDILFDKVIAANVSGETTVAEMCSALSDSIAKGSMYISRSIKRRASSVLPISMVDRRVVPVVDNKLTEGPDYVLFDVTEEICIPPNVACRHEEAVQALSYFRGGDLAVSSEDQSKCLRNVFGEVQLDAGKPKTFETLIESITICREKLPTDERRVFDREWR